MATSYVPSTRAERQAMLETLGLHSAADLYHAVPPAARVETLDLPAGKSEMEVTEELSALAAKNTVFRSVFRGAGAYKHYIPAVVKAITSKEDFVTAYTPYQAEISQEFYSQSLSSDPDLRTHRHGCGQCFGVRRRPPPRPRLCSCARTANTAVCWLRPPPTPRCWK